MFPFVSVEKNREHLICVWNAAENAQGGLTCAWIAKTQESPVNEEPEVAEETGELRRCA